VKYVSKKNIRLTEQDIQMLLDIYDHILLDVKHFAEVYYSETKNPKKQAYLRLNKLKNAGYIKALPILVDIKVHSRTQNGYTLTAKGLQVIEMEGIEPIWSNKWLQVAPNTWRHSLEIAGFFRAFKREADKRKDIEILEWLPDRRAVMAYSGLSSANQRLFKPDGILVINFKAADDKVHKLTFVLEWERSRHSKVDLEKKVRKLSTAGHTSEIKDHYLFRDSTLKRVFFVANEKRVNLKNLFQKLNGVKATPFGGMLVTSQEEVLEDPFGSIWHAVGRPYEETLKPWQSIKKKE
jgi:hypothetical protein